MFETDHMKQGNKFRPIRILKTDITSTCVMASSSSMKPDILTLQTSMDVIKMVVENLKKKISREIWSRKNINSTNHEAKSRIHI